MKAFELKITALETGESVTYERCSLICNHRFEILERTLQLCGTIEDRSSVTVPTSEKLHSLVKFIEDHSTSTVYNSSNTVTITVNGDYLASFKKNSKVSNLKESIKFQADTYHGKPTTSGFDFKNPFEASLFLAYFARNFVLAD